MGREELSNRFFASIMGVFGNVCFVLFIVYNAMCGVMLIATPEEVLPRFQGAPKLTVPFFLHSIATFHIFIVVVCVLAVTTSWPVFAQRQLLLCGAALNLWDAVSQFFHWRVVWTHPSQVYVDVGLPAFMTICCVLAAVSLREVKPRKK
jgi:hypothetical protein